ncbi:MAG TPA: exonuclease domain-containing protein [Ktedonobacterales bacterium]
MSPDQSSGSRSRGNAAPRDLVRRAHSLLADRGVAVAADELASSLFGLSEGPVAAAWLAMLRDALSASPLFASDDDAGQWRLAAWDATHQRLEDVEFAVVDVETTGLAPGRHRITEVAVVLARGGEIKQHFRSLVQPERPIPQFITSFTGISNAMVRRAPLAAAVLPKVIDFIQSRPIVGHNVGFDLGFLQYEAGRSGLVDAFPATGVDTIALARRYIPGLRRARLDRVAEELHLPVGPRHRALADAMLTAQVFLLLLARARAAGCETLDDLLRAQSGVSAPRQGVPRQQPTGNLYLNPAWRQEFPTAPGVYLMRDAAGEVIYVGKAKVLKERLASYYNQPLGYTRKMDGLLQSVAAIETRVLGSELEALIVESSLIKQLQPHYNVQLKNHEHYPFIKVDVQHTYPRFYATREVVADGARYFGPFRTGRTVDVTLDLIHKVFPVRTCTRGMPPLSPPSEPCLRYHLKRCPAPCRAPLMPAQLADYRAAVDEACKFLGGERQDLIDRLKQEMHAAAARQDFERAARLRDALRDADQVLLGQRLITGAVEANNLLIMYPSSEPEHTELYLIRHGRLASQRRSLTEHVAIREMVCALAAEASRRDLPPDRVGREEVDQINIIARWISRHSDDEERAFFRLPGALGDTEAVGSLADRIAAVALAGAAGDDEAKDDAVDNDDAADEGE